MNTTRLVLYITATYLFIVYAVGEQDHAMIIGFLLIILAHINKNKEMIQQWDFKKK